MLKSDNTKKRIAYTLQKKEHIRVFRCSDVDDRVVQRIIKPNFIPTEPFGLACSNYSLPEHRKKIIKKFKPDVFVQCDNSNLFHRKLTKYGIKSVFIGHGTVDRSESWHIRSFSSYWKNYDLLIGGLKMFRDLFENAGISSDKIITNALPQWDALYEQINNFEENRNSIFKMSSVKGFDKVITLFEHKLGRSAFMPNTIDYYRTAIKLEEIAKRNNWLIIIKSKRTKKYNSFSYLEGIAKNQAWAMECWPKYNQLQLSPNVVFVRADDEAYKYFCSDALVCTAISTIEVEACLSNRPMVIVRTDKVCKEDSLGTIKGNCVYLVDDIDDFEEAIMEAVMSPKTEKINNQKQYCEDNEITFDGKAYIRVIDALLGL